MVRVSQAESFCRLAAPRDFFRVFCLGADMGGTNRVRERPPMSLRCAVRSASSARGAHRGQASDRVGVSGHDTLISNRTKLIA